MSEPTVWALTTGEAGLRAQALGLARRIGGHVEEKICGLRGPWRLIPPFAAHLSLAGLDPEKDRLAPPWPDVLVSCGRRSGLMSIAVRRASGGRCLTVHVQDPQASSRRFDLVVAMLHDRIRGPNVIRSLTALHAVTPEELGDARALWWPRFAALPRPLTGVLIGGSTRRHPFTYDDADRLADGLLALTAEGHGLAITASRRTPEKVCQQLRRRLQGEAVWFWDGTGDNPYFAILGLADRLVVTADSLSMVSEALATGTPVEAFDFGGGRRQRTFLEGLLGAGYVRLFEGATDAPLRRSPVDATLHVAGAIRILLAARNQWPA